MGTVQLDVQGPKGLPVTGNLLAFRKDPLAFLKRAADEYGDIVHFRFGPRHLYLLNNPEFIKEVLVTKQEYFQKAKGLQAAKAALGEGILTSEGQKHLRQRRLMQPSFQPRRIAAYGETMVEKTKELLQSWSDGAERMITDDMMSVTLAIIVKTMFSLDVDKEGQGGIHNIGQAIEAGMKYVSRKASSFIDIPPTVPTKTNKEFQAAKERLNEIIYGIIQERRAQGNISEQHDLLGMLLAAKDEDDGTGMDDEQVRNEVMTIFIAGHETTANTLSWTWSLLSQHPEVEEKFWAELDNVLGGKDPTVDDLDKLPYLTNIIWESMRLYPAVWAINREVVKEVEIAGQLFQPGDTLMMSQYVMHRNPKYFTNPERYIPERFEDNFLKQIPAYAFFPFGGGPRVCIGNHFALMEAKLVLATIGQKYKLRLAANHPALEPEPLVTLRPKYGLRMQVFKRIGK